MMIVSVRGEGLVYCCAIGNGGVEFLRKCENRVDQICLLVCDMRKSEAKTILKFLDWKIKGRVMPLIVMGDLEEEGG